MARAKKLLGILTLAPMVVFAASQATEVPLLGEEYIKGVDQYASKIGQEANELFRTPLEEWNFYGSYDRGLKVYWRPVKDNKVGQTICTSCLTILSHRNVQYFPCKIDVCSSSSMYRLGCTTSVEGLALVSQIAVVIVLGSDSEVVTMHEVIRSFYFNLVNGLGGSQREFRMEWHNGMPQQLVV